MFNIDNSIDVKSWVLYRISVLRHNHVKYFKNKKIYHRRQGLDFSQISKMNDIFITSLDFMTFEHYIEQPMPTVERLVNRRLYKKIGL